MAGPDRTPVIIGVGEIKNASKDLADAADPATLMLRAISAALSDSSASSPQNLQSAIDCINVVATWTWSYPDLPGLIAEKLGVQGTTKHKALSHHGGNSPAMMLDDAARRVAKGESKVAVVTGGEALASCKSLCRAVTHGVSREE